MAASGGNGSVAKGSAIDLEVVGYGPIWLQLFLFLLFLYHVYLSAYLSLCPHGT